MGLWPSLKTPDGMNATVHVPYSRGQALPVKASINPLDILAFTGGACSEVYGISAVVSTVLLF